jgi:iron complex outermembrane receptor protein
MVDARTHEPIPYVTIESTDASGYRFAADAGGNFAFDFPSNKIMRFAAVGYTPRMFVFAQMKNGIIIELEPTTVGLQQVVVSASRARQARQDAPIAISKINATQIHDTKATALYQLLNKVRPAFTW